tara:strand:- start:212 stop:931 length:720 start_codon:yes stop_codon:yes gene_type:complete
MWLLFLLSCKLFYYGDDEVSQFEVSKVVNSWNIGINRAHSTSVKIVVMTDEEAVGHGSGNLFHYYNEFFVVTAAHVVDANLEYVLQEQNGNTVSCRVIYRDLYRDVAIIKPYGELDNTPSSPYLVNKQSSLTAQELYYSGFPGDLGHVVIHGWVADSSRSKIIMQSFAWPGSSGSVVFDNAGRVVGVVTAIPLVPNFYEGSMMPMSQMVMVSRLDVLPRKTIREALMHEKERIKDWNSD